MLTGPREGGELHIVLVDNGRSALLADRTHRSALACIRCGACLNTCPVYRRAGGHAYGTVIPGPIGSVLGPALGGAAGGELPHASSLCGSCTAVCPVKIDLHGQLLAWRAERRAPAARERVLTATAALALRWPAPARPRPRRAASALAAARPARPPQSRRAVALRTRAAAAAEAELPHAMEGEARRDAKPSPHPFSPPPREPASPPAPRPGTSGRTEASDPPLH